MPIPFANQGIHLYQLSNANAGEIATELTEILEIIEGPNPSYQVKGIERINALLVTAPATRGFEEISRWVQILDADSQEQVEQLFMYRVRNLLAVELAETLSEVFEEEDDPVVSLVGNDSGNQPPQLFPETGDDVWVVKTCQQETHPHPLQTPRCRLICRSRLLPTKRPTVC
jgi:hypothetical protein